MPIKKIVLAMRATVAVALLGRGAAHRVARTSGATAHPSVVAEPANVACDDADDGWRQWTARASGRLYAALLTDAPADGSNGGGSGSHGASGWTAFLVDLLSIQLAASHTIKEYSGKIQLWSELRHAEYHDVYSGAADVRERGEDRADAPVRFSLPPPAAAASQTRHRDIVAHACADTLLLLLKAMRAA
jgi:hypothetical protein